MESNQTEEKETTKKAKGWSCEFELGRYVFYSSCFNFTAPFYYFSILILSTLLCSHIIITAKGQALHMALEAEIISPRCAFV